MVPFAPRGGAVSAAQYDAWKVPRRECDSGPCAAVPYGESESCVLQCLAPDCYATVYAKAPLEPGEIDFVRQAEFNRCLHRLEATLRASGDWPPSRRRT